MPPAPFALEISGFTSGFGFNVPHIADTDLASGFVGKFINWTGFDYLDGGWRCCQPLIKNIVFK